MKTLLQVYIIAFILVLSAFNEAQGQNLKTLAAGHAHSLFIKNNGSLWAMGNNDFGQLGDGTTISTNRPKEIVSSDVVSVGAGYYHSLFVKADGSLWAMGLNNFGQLGDGTNLSTNRPEKIVSSGVVAVAAGSFEGGGHSLFLKSDGSLWGMGINDFGQLGDGTGSGTNRPVKIISTGVAAIAAGYYHSLFLNSDGSLAGMGGSGDGQLGSNLFSTLWPKSVVSSGVIAIAAGYYHSLFLTVDGGLSAMGNDWEGQLGDNAIPGSHSSVYNPKQILSRDVAEISGGSYHSLILKLDGSLWATGANEAGQLGDGTGQNQYIPKQIIASDVSAIAAGDEYSLFLKSDGSLWGMGANHDGQLGDGTSQGHSAPVRITSLLPNDPLVTLWEKVWSSTDAEYPDTVLYGNGKFIAYGRTGNSGGYLTSSEDALTWTEAIPNIPIGPMAFGGGIFVAAFTKFSSSDSRFHAGTATSTDGVHFTNIESLDGFSTSDSANNAPDSISYANGLFIVTGGGPAGAMLLTSSDGIQWKSRAVGVLDYVSAVAYGNGRFVAVGSSILTSEDGIIWKNQGVSHGLFSITFGNGVFVAVNENGEFARSVDGVNWSVGASPDVFPYQVVTGNNQFVVVGEDDAPGVLFVSPDGASWWNTANDTHHSGYYGVAFGNNRFVAVGPDGILRTTSGTPADLPFISKQPVGQTVRLGQSVGLSIDAVGQGPLKFEWVHAGTNIQDGVYYQGTASKTLFIPSVSISQGGEYFARVSNLNGSVDTVTVNLTVNTNLIPVTVTIDNLLQSADGQPKTVSVSTSPADLAVVVKYNGQVNLPILAGEYIVVATVIAPGFAGAATNTLVITPWAKTSSMVIPRTKHTATMLSNGKILVAGGLTFNGAFDVRTLRTEIFDQTSNTWTEGPPTATYRVDHTATVLKDGRVLVVGTSDSGTKNTEIFNPLTETWLPSGRVAIPRYGHTATLLQNGKVLITGGRNQTSDELTATSEIFDPTTEIWSNAAPMKNARQYHKAVRLLSGQVFVAGGRSEFPADFGVNLEPSAACEIYDPVANTWTETASMTSPRDTHSLTLLNNGEVLAVGGGGWSDGKILGTTELFNPVTKSWTETGDLNDPRWAHAAAILKDGRVMVSGGADHSNGFSTGVEVFDVSTARWTKLLPMTSSRSDHPLVVLDDGRVLAIGGNPFENTAELDNEFTAQPLLRIETKPDHTLNFMWNAIAGFTYRFESSATLEDWAEWISFTSASSAGAFQTNLSNLGPQRFFRLKPQ